MTFFVYVNTSKQVDDAEHVKVYATTDAAHDPKRPDPTVQPDNNQIPHCDGLRD
jgi:hypothetical protein